MHSKPFGRAKPIAKWRRKVTEATRRPARDSDDAREASVDAAAAVHTAQIDKEPDAYMNNR